MTFVRFNPYSEFTAMRSGLDHLLGPRPTRAPAASLSMPTDIIEQDSAFALTIDLPGVELADVAIEVHEGVLHLRASRAHPEPPQDQGLRRVERRFGQVERSFRLPKHVDEAAIEAKMSAGVLAITLPKVAAAQPRKITISA